MNIIDQCAAQGVPFAREYGGLLDNRSFGGTQVSRTFYARGQTGQQLLLGAYQAMAHQVALGAVKLYNRTETLDLVVKDGRAVGITCRDLVSGERPGARHGPVETEAIPEVDEQRHHLTLLVAPHLECGKADLVRGRRGVGLVAHVGR